MCRDSVLGREVDLTLGNPRALRFNPPTMHGFVIFAYGPYDEHSFANTVSRLQRPYSFAFYSVGSGVWTDLVVSASIASRIDWVVAIPMWGRRGQSHRIPLGTAPTHLFPTCLVVLVNDDNLPLVDHASQRIELTPHQ